MSRQPPPFITTVGSGKNSGPSSMSIKVQSKSLKEAKKQSEKLEQESRCMEDRLNDLKTILSRDRQERTGASSAGSTGNIWSSGKTGNLTRPVAGGGSAPVSKPKPEVKSEKENYFPKRIRVLKDIPIEVPKAPARSEALYSRLFDNKDSPVETPHETEPIPMCKQCDKKNVTLACVECGRNLCSMCFAKLHLKGEFKKHKSTPFIPQVRKSSGKKAGYQDTTEDYTTVLDGIKFTNVESNQKQIMPSRSLEKEDTKVSFGSERSQEPYSPSAFERSKEHSLASGPVFDEEASAASFQEALRNWRTSTKDVPRVSSKSIGDTTITDSAIESMPEINFSESSLSYAEKLLLKRNQKEGLQSVLLPNMSARLNSYENSDSGDDSDKITEAREQLRNQICSFLTPRGGENTNKSWYSSEIEITEMNPEDDAFSDVADTTLCSVVEPSVSPDAFQLQGMVSKEVSGVSNIGWVNGNINQDRTSTPAISEYDPADDEKDDEKPVLMKPTNGIRLPQKTLTAAPVFVKREKSNIESSVRKSAGKKPTKPVTPKEPRKPATPQKTQPKTPKQPAAKPSSASRSGNQTPKQASKPQKPVSRPTSASTLTTAPSAALSSVANRKTRVPQNYNSGLDQFFSVQDEELTGRREKSDTKNKENIHLPETSLLTGMKSQGTWQRDVSLLVNTNLSLKKSTNFTDSNIADSDITKELELIDGLSGSWVKEESPKLTHRVPLRPLSARRETTVHDSIALPLDSLSDGEDDEQKALEDLEYELACNTGRTTDGRVDRIGTDLEGILHDMDMTQTPLKHEDSYYAEMDQDYISDEEDFCGSVRNL